jgi:nicotinamide riboside kinase
MLKIIFTGPESSGKTTLSKAIAKHFEAPLVEEYAREYFEKKQPPLQRSPYGQYFQTDLTEIAKGQIENEKRHIKPKTRLIVCDTDILTIKIWSEVVYGNCLLELTELINTHHPSPITHHPSHITHHLSIYFLCSPEGIEWEYDPLRENPDDRDFLFKIYEKELIFYKKNYQILRGSFEQRFEKCVESVLEILRY